MLAEHWDTVFGAAHTLPHPPQLFGSLFVATHTLLQLTSPVGQVISQVGGVPETHDAVPPVGAVQRLHVSPQEVFDVDVSEMHVPLQLCVPVGQAHVPF